MPEDHLLQQRDIVRALFNAAALLKNSKDILPGLANQGNAWTADEDNQLKEEFANGIKISQLAKDHQRTPGAIRARLKKLKLTRCSWSMGYAQIINLIVNVLSIHLINT